MAFLIQAGHCPGFLFFVALGEFVGRCDGAAHMDKDREAA